jgi:hypothetical protein
MNGMNGMNPLRAMLTGTAQGAQQAASILPNSYQPRGKAAASNPFSGSLDLLCNQLLEIAYGVQSQGDKFRECKERLYKAAYEISKINNELTDIAQGDEESAGY